MERSGRPEKRRRKKEFFMIFIIFREKQRIDLVSGRSKSIFSIKNAKEQREEEIEEIEESTYHDVYVQPVCPTVDHAVALFR